MSNINICTVKYLIMNEFILASASPRRKALLQEAGFKFQVITSGVPEDAPDSLSPMQYAMHISALKADAVAALHADAVVLAADTIVVLGSTILGKPTSPDDAIKMLTSLSGNMHEVITAYAVVHKAAAKRLCAHTVTQVMMHKLTDEQILKYVQTGEPMDKAGSYGIQALGGALVKQIDGSYDNVVGLPLSDVIEALKDFGITPAITPDSSA